MFNQFLNRGVDRAIERAREKAEDLARANWDCGKSATFNFFRTGSWQKSLVSCVTGAIRGHVKRSGWWAKLKYRIKEGAYSPKKVTCYWYQPKGKKGRSKCRRVHRGDFPN
jgi:hypothetical protein